MGSVHFGLLCSCFVFLCLGGSHSLRCSLFDSVCEEEEHKSIINARVSPEADDFAAILRQAFPADDNLCETLDRIPFRAATK